MNALFLFYCSHCCVTRIQTLLQIQKQHGCSVRTSVNTIGEYGKLLSRVGLLISLSVAWKNLKNCSLPCLNNIELDWSPRPIIICLLGIRGWMFGLCIGIFVVRCLSVCGLRFEERRGEEDGFFFSLFIGLGYVLSETYSQTEAN